MAPCQATRSSQTWPAWSLAWSTHAGGPWFWYFRTRRAAMAAFERMVDDRHVLMARLQRVECPREPAWLDAKAEA